MKPLPVKWKCRPGCSGVSSRPGIAGRFIRRLRSACRFLPLLLLPGVLLPAPATAQILIEPKVGFRGVFQLGRPFPLEVTLDNSGRPADGILEIQVWKRGAVQGGAPHASLHRQEVFLPARSRRSVHFTIDPDFLSRPLKISFTSAAASASRELDLRSYFSPAPIVLSVAEGSAVPLTSLGMSLPSRIVALSLAELPAEGRALLGVSHLVLYDQSLRDLSRAHLLALDDWLAAGGRMVIVGSLNFALYQEPQLARYLPVRVTGARRTVFDPFGETGKGKPVAGVWAQTATVLKGTVVTESQGMPVLVENNWGKGKVVYLALDAGRPPLSSWPGLPKLLQNLLAPAESETPPLRSQWNEAIFSQLLLDPSFISSYIPSGPLMLVIVVYLAGVLLLSRLWRRRRLTPRALVLSCCGWILCTAAAGYFFFSRGGRVPDGVLLAAAVMENAGDGYVDTQRNLALFSTRLREYSLAPGRGWMDLTPLAAPAQAQAEQSAVYRHGGGATRLQLPLRDWDYKLLRARQLERLGVSTTIERQGGELMLKVENQSGRDLTDCWLLAPGTRIALGDLPRGERWSRVFPVGAGGGDSGGRNPGEVSVRKITFKESAHDILFHASFFSQEGPDAPWRNGAALFFGWVRDPEARFEIGDPRIQVRSYALYRAIVPLAGAEEE